jgi:hypothetical protein
MKDDPAHAQVLLRDLELINRRTEREYGRRAAGGRSREAEPITVATKRTTLAASHDANAADAALTDAALTDPSALDTGAFDPPTDSPLE